MPLSMSCERVGPREVTLRFNISAMSPDLTALAHDAEMRTQDAHFDGLPGVRYFAKSGE